MFKGGNGKTTVPNNSPDQLNRLVEGTTIKGDVRTESNFRLDGVLVGTLITTGKVVIGQSGRIEGEVKCANADIEGELVGDIVVDGLLTIKSTAKIHGNITTKQIGMEVGCEFRGLCNYADKADQPVVANTISKVKEEDSELVY